MNRSIPAIAFVLAAPVALAGTFEFQGQAIADNGDTLYTEHHQMQGECSAGSFAPTRHQVEYRSPDGEAFAEKQLAFERSPLMPAVDFSQPTFSEQLTIGYSDNNEVKINWQTPKGARERYSVGVPDQLVVDSGFDHFVRSQWQTLTKTDSARFRFLGPTRGDHFGFVAEPVNNSEIDADLVVRLRPTSLVLRVLVDPIILGYNQQGALTHYQGLTNIRKNADTNYTATIRYEVDRYPDCSLLP